MSSSSIQRMERVHRLRVRFAITLAAAFVLIAAPVAQAANATNINVQLPAGFSIAGTIRDAAGAVLPGAGVYAFGTTSSGGAQTNSSGQYKIDGLNAGQFTILVSSPTAKNLVDGYYTTANANHFTPLSASATKVTVGPNKTGINIKMPTGLTIKGKITTTTGTAIAGVGVSTFGVSSDSTTTDASGNYTLKGLAAGTYKLSLYPPSTSNYLRGYYTTANANRFTIAFASASGIVIGPSKTGVNVKLPTGYTISGTIKNTSGVPQEGISVQPSSSTYFGGGASTDATGKYTIKGLAAATYKLALSPGSESPLMDGYYTTTNANHFTSAIGGASGIAVSANKTGINANIVTGRTISGMITTTTGTPIEGATVDADNLGHSRSADTDAAGKYTIRGLSSAGQTLEMNPPYGENFMFGWYTTGNANHFTTNKASATKVVVPPNAINVNMKVPKGYSISGKITGPGGTPISFAYVQADKAGYSGYAFTEADGTYLINGLGSGTYKVQVQSFSGNYQSGYYTTANGAHFTVNAASATGVLIGP